MTAPGTAAVRTSRWRALAGSAALVVAAAAVAVPGAAASPPAPAPSTASAAGTSAADRDQAPPGFVALSDVDPTVHHDVRYAGHHNFVGQPVVGYREPLCVLTREAAEALGRAQDALRPQGYALKVYDCYRPQRAVDEFARWAATPGDRRMKEEFYPRVDKSVLFDEGYIARRSGHSRGSTVDLTLVELPAPPQRGYVPGEPLVPCFAPYGERFPDSSVDMGTGYDCFDTLAHTDDPRVTGEARRNRRLLVETMERAGFRNYPAEWWHYTLVDEPYPDTYFDFPVARRALGAP